MTCSVPALARINTAGLHLRDVISPTSFLSTAFTFALTPLNPHLCCNPTTLDNCATRLVGFLSCHASSQSSQL